MMLAVPYGSEASNGSELSTTLTNFSFSLLVFYNNNKRKMSLVGPTLVTPQKMKVYFFRVRVFVFFCVGSPYDPFFVGNFLIRPHGLGLGILFPFSTLEGGDFCFGITTKFELNLMS